MWDSSPPLPLSLSFRNSKNTHSSSISVWLMPRRCVFPAPPPSLERVCSIFAILQIFRERKGKIIALNARDNLIVQIKRQKKRARPGYSCRAASLNSATVLFSFFSFCLKEGEGNGLSACLLIKKPGSSYKTLTSIRNIRSVFCLFSQEGVMNISKPILILTRSFLVISDI